MIDTLNTYARKLPAWAVYLIGFAPMPFLFWQGITGALGVDPVKALEHEYGELALQLLVLGLAITPARRHLGLNLLKFRRAIGVLSFFYVLAHLLVWAVLDVQALGAVWADILKRPYITIGMAAFALLLPLAITSNNRSVRKLGPRWRQLHKLTYPAVILGGVHYVWLVKGWQVEPLIYMAVILTLLALRAPKKRKVRVAA
ncbi:protein-methionine-sulfoxide reductase heme-binding subunit MsrQ [Thalassovita mediterranea]|jgi:sulfoxide reductase heme-binding subunit YedZ|uniref:Protein-methionine-sulfoxide reductase heme-binding subunit MsrQ n=1 Tax=Thalassovita mediterranea TaxID=340021 RepID=A0A0P1GRR1_9RHOB|nr:protein-methionine-sulfoxide reductase heme-binding subunit MsrQ [Thalassovita mediterranea]CUH85384.1 Flavocytochrome YedZ [Thalassovita mediterranea]SIS30336.1 sulfoxide reductase heme-binding subunit YedZ [Thalassovita mediterranea]